MTAVTMKLPPTEAPVPGAPHDRVFNAWAVEGVVWLPERGMGKLRVREAPYDVSYWDKYVGYAATEMGRKITAARVELVNRYTEQKVVDVGIGCGAFIAARKWTWGYDVNPEGVRWLQDNDLWCDPYKSPSWSISLWDVLEHIPDPAALLDRVNDFVFVSVPIVPGDGPPPPDWKHLRRDEHIWYWTDAGFVAWMGRHGFDLIEHNRMEEALGREDIGTYVFRRTA